MRLCPGRAAVFIFAAAVVAGCDDDPTTPRPNDTRRPMLIIVSGSGQTGEVGTALAAPFVVRVLDTLGAPVPGALVRFASTVTAVRDSSITDGRGEASVRWVLDTYAGEHDISARATLYPEKANGSAAAMFRAVAKPGAPARLWFYGGDGAVAAPNTQADTVIVESVDRYGNRTYREPVVWTVVAGGGTVRPLDDTIDEYGYARAVWVMGGAEGTNAIDVSVGSLTRRASATASVAFQAQQVVTGDTHTCALAISGAAYCWGGGSSGQLGIGRTVDGPTLSPRRVPGLMFTSLVAGAEHTCGLLATGAAYCWGNSRAGQTGTGAIGLVTDPTKVVALSFLALAAGQRHTCGLSTAGSILCWGDNSLGQLGSANDRPVGPQGSRLEPVLILVNGAAAFHSIAAGANSTCAISADGFAYCWGANGLRELGGDYPGRCTLIGTQMFYDGTTPVACSADAVRISGLAFTTLAAHRSGWCGVTLSRTLVCWGNAIGPLAIAGSPVLTAWVVGSDACGLEASGRVTCWGVWRGTPGAPIVRPFGDQVELRNIGSGLLHSCGVTTDGRDRLYCWGDNSRGQLGDGTTTWRTLPVPVLSPRIE